MTLENPTILLQRDDRGWNFNRFVKTRQNTGGRGAPPITMESIAIKNGHVIVKDRDRLIEDLTRFNTQLRFAYEKPGDRHLDCRALGERGRDESAAASPATSGSIAGRSWRAISPSRPIGPGS